LIFRRPVPSQAEQITSVKSSRGLFIAINHQKQTKKLSSPYAMVAAGRNRATQNPFGSDDGQYFYEETDFGFPEFNRSRHTITRPYEHGLRLSSGGKSSHADGRRSDQRN
jgi:hypothetical protein